MAPVPAADDDDDNDDEGAVAVFDFGCCAVGGGGAIRSARSRVPISGDTSHRGTPSTNRAHSNARNIDQSAGAERRDSIRAGSVAADHSDSDDDEDVDDEDDDEVKVDADTEAEAEADPDTVCFGFLLAISISASACSRVCTQCCSHRSATRD